MTVSSPVPNDAPVMVAWTAYKQTEEYANTLRWAKTEHSEGSLWAAFEQGFRAAKDAGPPEPGEPTEEEVARVIDPAAMKIAHFNGNVRAKEAIRKAQAVQQLFRSRRNG